MSFSCSADFSIPLQGRVTYSSFRILSIYFGVRWDSKVHNSASPLFFVDYCKVLSSGRYLGMRLYRKIPVDFVCLILTGRLLVVHIALVRRVKLQFLARFPVDPLAHPVMPSLIHFRC